MKTLLSLRIHLAHHRFTDPTLNPLSLRWRSADSAVVPAIAPAFTTQSLLLLLLCRSAFTTVSLRCRSAVTPLLLRCRSAIAPLSLRYCSAIAPLSLRYRSIITPLSLRCCSAPTAVTPDVAPLPPLLLLLPSLLLPLTLFTVAPSRCRIRVTLSIGDCQARVPSCS